MSCNPGQHSALIIQFAHPSSRGLVSKTLINVPLRGKQASGKMEFQDINQAKHLP